MISKATLHPSNTIDLLINTGVVSVIVSLDKETLDRLSENVEWNMAQVEPDEDLIAMNLLECIIKQAQKGFDMIDPDKGNSMSREISGPDPIWTSKTTYAPVASKWEVEARYFPGTDAPVVTVQERSNFGNLGEVVNYELYKVDVEGVSEQNARILGMALIELKKKLNEVT